MRGLSRHAVTGLTLVVTSLIVAPCGAAVPQELTLTWAAPDTCPQAGAFQALVEGFLRQPLAERRQQRLSVAGAVSAAADGTFRLRLQVVTAAGTQARELAHQDCRELTEAAALVTALAIDPNLVIESPPPEPAPPPAAPAATSPAAPPLPSPSPEPVPSTPLALAPPHDRPEGSRPAASPWQPSLVALGLAGNSVLPGVGVGVGARAALGANVWRIALRGVYWSERFEPIAGSENAGLAMAAWSVGVRACGVPVAGRLAVWACVGPDVGQLRANGEGLERARAANDRWSAVNAELSLVHTASSGLMTQLGFELGKTLEAPRFGISVDGNEFEVFRANGWLAHAFVGFGFSFSNAK